jgi:two-component system, NtrC family, sensor kinase
VRSLHEGEELLARLYEVVPGGIVHVARDGTLTSANLEARRILGLPDDDATARSIADWEAQTLNEYGSPCAREDHLVASVLATGQAQGPRTLGVRRAGGDEVWVVGRAVPVLDAEGNLAGAIATFLDISERKRVNEKLRRSEERWRLLAESVPDSVAVIDADGRILSINHVFPELSEERVLRLCVYDFISDEVVAEYRANVAKTFASQSITRFETRGYGANGTTAWYDTILVPRIDGEAERVLVVARDITDRKRAEEAMASSELRWRALVGSLPDNILVVDRERTILSLNREGSEHARVIGTKCDPFIDAPMLEQWLGHFASALDTGMPVRLETRGWSSPGRLSWYESVLVPLKSGGNVDRVMIVARDISERRAMLAGLAEKERLASVGMVAASVAHEVMNPLTHILANLDAALGARQLDDTSRMQAVVEARVAARRMQQIVWDLRALLRRREERPRDRAAPVRSRAQPPRASRPRASGGARRHRE